MKREAAPNPGREDASTSTGRLPRGRPGGKPAGYRFAPSPLPAVLAAVLFTVLCGLGFWQLDRASGKEGRQAELQAARDVLLDESALGREPHEFARIELVGRYDPEHQFLQDNRTHRGRAGYYVLTPFRTARHGAVLVNRGWTPAAGDRSVLPEIAISGGETRVRGTVRLPREDLFVLGDTGYAAPDWPRLVQRVEIDAVRQALGYPVAAWVVVLDPEAPHGYVREWKAFPGPTPARHRGYAFQWFALAAALLAIWVAVGLKKREREP